MEADALAAASGENSTAHIKHEDALRKHFQKRVQYKFGPWNTISPLNWSLWTIWTLEVAEQIGAFAAFQTKVFGHVPSFSFRTK